MEFFTTYLRTNHKNIPEEDPKSKQRGRIDFDHRFDKAKSKVKAQQLVKDYVLDNNIKFEVVK